MTELTKPIRRRTRGMFGHYRKRIVVTLEPGDLIALRLERSRTTFRATIAGVYRQVVAWNAEAERQRKRALRKLKRIA
jgi:hypothetical protein